MARDALADQHDAAAAIRGRPGVQPFQRMHHVLDGMQHSGPFRLFRTFPVLRRIPARIIGVGFRPEHVRTPQVPVVTSRRSAKASATA